MSLRSGNISVTQKDELIKFMKENPKLTLGKYSSSFTIQDGQNLWRKCANLLNAIPGAHKDWIHWRKTWQDVRKGVKSKNAKLRKEVLMTGGGPPPDIQFDQQENAILQMMSTSQLEGHGNIFESDTTFNFGDSEEILEENDIKEDLPSTSQSFTPIAKNKENVAPGPSSLIYQNKKDGNHIQTEHDYHKVSRKRKNVSYNKDNINIELVRLSEKKILSEGEYRKEKLQLLRMEYERKIKNDEDNKNFQCDIISLLKEITNKLK